MTTVINNNILKTLLAGFSKILLGKPQEVVFHNYNYFNFIKKALNF